MFLIVPYHVDVPMQSPPWMNWALIGLTIVCYPLCISGYMLTPLGEEFTAGGKSWLGLFGHVLVHADLFHLLGNMLFLWVFGNAVCSKVGNLPYFFVYFGLAAVGGLITLAIDPTPGIGASGAINGIVGMFVVLYLLNEISCWYGYWFFVGYSGVMQVSSFWMVLLWLGFDILGALRGGGHIGYIAHLVGFTIGFGLAVFLLRLRWIEMDRGERSLLQLFSGETEDERTPPKTAPKRVVIAKRQRK